MGKKIVYIKWIDSFSSGDSWISNELSEGYKSDELECIIEQVGFIFHETQKYITLVSAIGRDNKQNLFKIPKLCIIKKKILK